MSRRKTSSYYPNKLSSAPFETLLIILFGVKFINRQLWFTDAHFPSCDWWGWLLLSVYGCSRSECSTPYWCLLSHGRASFRYRHVSCNRMTFMCSLYDPQLCNILHSQTPHLTRARQLYSPASLQANSLFTT